MSEPDDLAKARARARIVTGETGGGGALMASPSLREQERNRTRSRRKREVRKVTVNLKREPLKERTRLAILGPDAEQLAELERLRPKTRGDCEESFRPCPFVGCQYNLFLDIGPSGNVILNFPDLEPEQLVESCALDVADHGGETLEVVGECLNVTRERIRQIENRALFRVQRRSGAAFKEFADQSEGPRVGARNLRRSKGSPAASGNASGYRCHTCGELGHNARTCPNGGPR